LKRRSPAHYEDEPPTHVEAPLPTRYDPDTRTYHFDAEPQPLPPDVKRGRRRR
jgi:hypothetical protein